MHGTPESPGARDERRNSRGRPAEVLVDPRVLLVEANQAFHDDVRGILEPDHFLVDSAFHGEDAVACVKQALAQGSPYAVMVLDGRMAQECIATIRHVWHEDPDVQVVVCTASGDRRSAPEIVAQLGPADGLLLVRKPFDDIALRQMVHALAAKWMLNRELHIRLGDLEVAGEPEPLLRQAAK